MQRPNSRNWARSTVQLCSAAASDGQGLKDSLLNHGNSKTSALGTYGSSDNSNGYTSNSPSQANQGTNSPALPEPRWDPVLQKLLHLLTHEDELCKLTKQTSKSTFRSPAVRLQNDVNELAFSMSSFYLSQSDTNVGQAVKDFSDISNLLPGKDKGQLLKLPTSTASHPELVPILYYAVASGSTQLVSFLLEQGADPNPKPADHNKATTMQQVPPLAVAIVRKDHNMVLLLLQNGARPLGIPSELYLRSMHKEGLHAMPQPNLRFSEQQNAATAWCKGEEDSELLQQCLDLCFGCGLTMQYWLTRALKLPELTDTCKRIAQLNKLERVPGLRLGVIGQEIACAMLYHHIIVHCGMSDKRPDQQKPLVLILAGPPGHGKTLLGHMMQHVLPGAKYHYEDCTKLHHTVDLWGATGSFKLSERRPAFAECLATNSGKASVVLLDEFEKMPTDVHHTLLSVLEKGHYVDAFEQREVDCRHTVFLLTTNAADRMIMNYWQLHRDKLLKISLQPSVLLHELNPLVRQIKSAVAGCTSMSLVSRLTGVVPFLPFMEVEQMLVVQHALLDLAAGLAKPPDENQGRGHGSIQLVLKDQPKVCRQLAKDTYNEAEGARAVVNEVNCRVGMDIKTALLEEHLKNGEIAELSASKQQGALYTLTYCGSNHKSATVAVSSVSYSSRQTGRDDIGFVTQPVNDMHDMV